MKLENTSLDKLTEYKVEVKNVKTESELPVDTKSVNFTTSNLAVVTDIFDKNFTGDATDSDLLVEFDEILDWDSVTTSNVTLTDVETGKKIPVALYGEDLKTIDIWTDKLIEKKQYTLSIKNVKTSTGAAAEEYTYTFAVDADPINLSSPDFSIVTLDGKSDIEAGLQKVWPKLTSGTLEDGTYYAGLQAVMKFNTKLDASTIDGNIELVEKDSETVVPAKLTYNADAKTVTVVPNADLKEGTDYVLTVKGGLKTEFGIALDPDKLNEVVTGGEFDFTTFDLTSPTVTSIVSKNGDNSLEVGKTQEFTVKFSEAVLTPVALEADLSNIEDAQIALVKAGAKLDDLEAEDVVEIDVDEVTTEVGTFKVRVASGDLDRNQAYKLVVLGKDNERIFAPVVDDSSNTLKKSYVFAFTTEGEDVAGPVLQTVYKGNSFAEANVVTTATNVNDGKVFTFLFNEELDTTKLDDVSLEKYNNGRWETLDNGDYSISTTEKPNAEGENVGVVVTLTNIPDEDGKFRVVLGNSAANGFRDANDNVMKNKAYFEFTATDGQDTVASVEAVDAATLAEDLTPVSLPATDVVTDSKLLITFAEDQLAEVKAENVVVKDSEGNTVAGTLQAVDGTTDQFIFFPTAKLAASTTYSITIDGVKDKAGNSIAKKVTSFKTAATLASVTSIGIEDGATNVDRSKRFTFTLSKAEALTKSTHVILEDADGNEFTDYTLYSADSKNYTIIFNGEALESLTEYTLTIQKDNTYIDEAITFITGTTATDDVKPTFISMGTWADSLDDADDYTALFTRDELASVVAYDADLSSFALQFSEGMDASDATITVTNVTDDKAVAVLSKSVKDTNIADEDGEVVLVNLVTALNLDAAGTTEDPTKTYKVEVKGLTDANGVAADTVTFYIN